MCIRHCRGGVGRACPPWLLILLVILSDKSASCWFALVSSADIYKHKSHQNAGSGVSLLRLYLRLCVHFTDSFSQSVKTKSHLCYNHMRLCLFLFFFFNLLMSLNSTLGGLMANGNQWSLCKLKLNPTFPLRSKLRLQHFKRPKNSKWEQEVFQGNISIIGSSKHLQTLVLRFCLQSRKWSGTVLINLNLHFTCWPAHQFNSSRREAARQGAAD